MHKIGIHPPPQAHTHIDPHIVKHSIVGLDDFNKNVKEMNKPQREPAFSKRRLEDAERPRKSAMAEGGKRGRGKTQSSARADSASSQIQELNSAIRQLTRIVQELITALPSQPAPAPHPHGHDSARQRTHQPASNGLSPGELEALAERKQNDPSGTGPTTEPPVDVPGRAGAFVGSLTPAQLDLAAQGAAALEQGKAISESNKALFQSLASLLAVNHSSMREILQIIKEGHSTQQGLQHEIDQLKRSVANLSGAQRHASIFGTP